MKNIKKSIRIWFCVHNCQKVNTQNRTLSFCPGEWKCEKNCKPRLFSDKNGLDALDIKSDRSISSHILKQYDKHARWLRQTHNVVLIRPTKHTHFSPKEQTTKQQTKKNRIRKRRRRRAHKNHCTHKFKIRCKQPSDEQIDVRKITLIFQFVHNVCIATVIFLSKDVNYTLISSIYQVHVYIISVYLLRECAPDGSAITMHLLQFAFFFLSSGFLGCCGPWDPCNRDKTRTFHVFSLPSLFSLLCFQCGVCLWVCVCVCMCADTINRSIFCLCLVRSLFHHRLHSCISSRKKDTNWFNYSNECSVHSSFALVQRKQIDSFGQCDQLHRTKQPTKIEQIYRMKTNESSKLAKAYNGSVWYIYVS